MLTGPIRLLLLVMIHHPQPFVPYLKIIFFHQMVLNPTRDDNILDLVLSTTPDLLFDLGVNKGQF